TRRSNFIQCVRSVFKYGYDAGFLDAPIRFGPGFSRPRKKVLQEQRKSKPKRMFAAEEIRDMIDAASVQLKAMILLGVNCGFGNNDCAMLPIEALDLAGGWVDFSRPKTSVDRRCKLWPETVTALRDVLAARRAPTNPDYNDRVFITKY